MSEQHPNVDFDVEQEYELVWRSESQLNEKVIINTHEQVFFYFNSEIEILIIYILVIKLYKFFMVNIIVNEMVSKIN